MDGVGVAGPSAARRHILKTGAGEGGLGHFLWPCVPVLSQCRYTGLDLWRERPANWSVVRDWHRADLLAHDFVPAPQLLFISFLLHQFRDKDLVRPSRTPDDNHRRSVRQLSARIGQPPDRE